MSLLDRESKSIKVENLFAMAAAAVATFAARIVAGLFMGSSQTAPARHDVSPEGKNRLIMDRAYRYTQERGFAPGDPMQDWLRAEKEVESDLAGHDGSGRY